MPNTVSNVADAAQIKIVQLIAKDLGVGANQVAAAVALRDKRHGCAFVEQCHGGGHLIGTNA